MQKPEEGNISKLATLKNVGMLILGVSISFTYLCLSNEIFDD